MTAHVYGSCASAVHITAQLICRPPKSFFTFSPDVTFTYLPNPGYAGSDSFTFTRSGALATSNTATVSIDVYNNPPYAYDASFSVLHDRQLTGQVYGYDPDGDDITAELISGPANGTLIFMPDGTFIYRPHGQYVGSDSFTYTWNDGIMETQRNVIIDVYNMPPFSIADYYCVLPGRELIVYPAEWLQNDLDLDSDSLILVSFGAPSHGDWQSQEDGSYKYVPEPGFVGLDELEYSISDGVTIATGKVIFEVTESLLAGRDDVYHVAAGETLYVSPLGVLANDCYATGTVPETVVASSSQYGQLDLGPDGSFTYTPDEDFAGEDEFSYVLLHEGQASQPAKVKIKVVRITVQGPAWVPINANNDHGSDWEVNLDNKYFIPKRRDFDWLARLPAGREDPELTPITVSLEGVDIAQPGFVSVTVERTNNATGAIRLWIDRQKSRRAEGIFPLVGPNALPRTIYVEGTALTSRTIVNNAIKPEPDPDNKIKVTYYNLVLPPPGQLAMPIPVAWGELRVGVGPVVQFFTINNSPIPPNPQVPERIDARVVFINGRDIRAGYRTEGVNDRGERRQRSVVFDAQVFKDNISGGDIQFVQNIQIRNGDGNQRPNAFTFRKHDFFKITNKRFVFVDDQGREVQRPVLDSPAERLEHPWYESTKVPIVHNPNDYLQITTADTPAEMSLQTMVYYKLFDEFEITFFDPKVPEVLKNEIWSTLVNVDYEANFEMFLVWVTAAGAGSANAPAPQNARTLYTLAVRPWQVKVHLSKGPGSKEPAFLDQLGNSAVLYDGDFVMAGHRNPIIVGPLANAATRLVKAK